MILDDYIVAKWKSTNKEWYESKGYILTEDNHSFLCRPLDLLPKSNIKIKVRCDYCQVTINLIPFYTYKKKVLDVPIQKYACSKCRQRKVEEMSLFKNGVKYSHQISYNQVEEMFENYEYTLLTKEENYRKVAQKLKYICPKHGEQYNSYNDLQQGTGCKYCGYEKTAKSRIKYNFQDISEYFKLKGYELLEESYRDAHQLLKYRCLKHPEYIQDVSFTNFIHLNNGCKYCAIEKRAKLRRLDFNEVKSILDNKGLILLEDTYINSLTDLKYICKNKPNVIQYANLAEIKARTYCCPLCFSENNKGENHHSWKGGLTPLHNFLRGNINQWKLDSMKKYKYKCILSNLSFEAIHHLYNFNKIMLETLEILELPIYDEISKYNSQELENLSKTCLELHYKYGLGVLLTEPIHKLYHSLYGNDNTPEQFEEFKIRYKMGEFNKLQQLQMNKTKSKSAKD